LRARSGMRDNDMADDLFGSTRIEWFDRRSQEAKAETANATIRRFDVSCSPRCGMIRA
jgi:hypothetical protein